METSHPQNSLKISKRIQLLPEYIVDQIKAGEVIEKPASLIKEILENSLDAGATQIDLVIKNNGLDLIRLTDDGEGMSFDDLPFAFCRHATSKIRAFEDLYQLNSFGFRGEALASIASIARVNCSSFNLKSNSGGKITIHSGRQQGHLPFHQQSSGTSLVIQDLFYNTPARLKFLKSQQSEKNALKKVIHAFILSSPETSFSIQWDDKEKEVYPALPKEKIKNRIEQIFFKRRQEEKEIISFKKEYEGHKIHGFLSKESKKGHSGRQQFLFANGRLFIDKLFHQSILRSSFWPEGFSGHYVLFINAPNHLLDANVHPNKTFIKFAKMSMLNSLISSGVKEVSLEKKAEPNFSTPEPQQELNSESLKGWREDHAPPSSNTSGLEFDKSFFKLGPYFFVFNFKNDQFLMNSKEVLKTFLEKTLHPNNYEEDKLIPLLISGPFKEVHIPQSKLDSLKNYGLELEPLEEDNSQEFKTYVLRTLPDGWENIHYRPLVQSIISSEKGSISATSLGPQDIIDIWKSLGEPSKFIFPLTQEKLQSLF
jgi:DNA mismatch repair protein MutL